MSYHKNYNKQDIVNLILKSKNCEISKKNIGKIGKAFAPSNIALCKYWGKRDLEINLPNTSSLSISLGEFGARTSIQVDSRLRGNDEIEESPAATPLPPLGKGEKFTPISSFPRRRESTYKKDKIYLNKKPVDINSDFYKRLTKFLGLFRFNNNYHYEIYTEINIPVASGLASSACGFAAIVLALNNLFDWNLDNKDLSILSRLGSGSASRSIYQGFAIWHAGEQENGMDSFAEKLDYDWPELKIGFLIIDSGKKYLSSREAMLRTVKTSKLYNSWENQVNQDLEIITQAIKNKDFKSLGETAENNALAMHACMLAAKPAILYSKPETIELMHKIWQLRTEGLEVYFTQDAGPNLKLIFQKDDEKKLQEIFSNNLYL